MQERITLRQAQPADAAAIASVLVASWRATYQGIVADEFLASLSVEQQTVRWAEKLRSDAEGCFVADAPPGEIVGFASGGACRSTTAGEAGELYAVYLLPQYQGMGIGRNLVAAVLGGLLDRRLLPVRVVVLSENRAVGFYERIGAVRVRAGTVEFGGRSYPEVEMEWTAAAVETLAGHSRGKEAFSHNA